MHRQCVPGSLFPPTPFRESGDEAIHAYVHVNVYVHNDVYVRMQVKVPSLQSRCTHSATAFNLSPGLIEVILFGGYSEWPSNLKSAADITPIANTTVLRFGEYTSFGVWVNCNACIPVLIQFQAHALAIRHHG